ncbi:uncharacterized protein LOC111641388 [Centruroides sculpturatus]|uniref:uncharacterized protein LOC111641388 n=1 Tax=Centruroides sculpturatus TaxID=218467 RepID=UPI000C6EDF6F|nr:uncharacterized protein LOC111641388 [Centruroides sculpturatus]
MQHPELLYVNKISSLQSELLKVKEDLYRCRKQKMIYRKKLKTLQTENLKLHQKNTELKIRQLLADKLDSLLPRQKLVIEHMLKACHIKSKKVHLHQYIRGINAKFGFDEDLFVILKTKLETIPQTECQGVLIFDEITLQKHIELSNATSEMIGLVNCGDNSELPQSEFTAGDHGLVFMFRPHFASWVQCIGTFCSKSSVPGSTVAKLILQAIIHLEQCGAIVNAIVCDGASTNKAALKALGICADTNNIQCSFTNPAADRQVLAIIDVPHILKCMRNNLLKSRYFRVN